jgi:hypothetical protein
MKKFLFFISFCFLFGATINVAQASTMAEKLKGKILIQVESHGEAWYVNANDGQRYYLGRPSDAFNVMRKLGLGISNTDFEKVKNNVPLKLAGKILLKVQDKGQAYYINPTNMRLYFLGHPSDAFAIMRSLGLGISNNNLNTINVAKQDTAANSSSPAAVATEKNTTTTTEKIVSNGEAPIISSIKVANGGDKGYVDFGDVITITFNEAIDPKSINSSLEKGNSVSDVYYYKTGGVSIAVNGLVTISNIASFDMGSIEKNDNFTVKISLDFTGKILTIIHTGGIGDDTAIANESFSSAAQIKGTIKDESGNTMLNSSINNLSGSFGGGLDDDSGTPYISTIKINNYGDDGFIDTGDIVTITFDEAIDPESINDDLRKGNNITDISYSSTGGVSVSSAGKVTIKNIATFDMGSVGSSGTFTAMLALNSTGKTLTITLTSGNDIKIISESYSSTNQTGGTIKDAGEKEMITITDINNPTGTFGGVTSDSNSPYISSMVIANKGDIGYIDTGDTITITFSEAIDPGSINDDLEKGSYISGVSYSSTGGVSVSSVGNVTIKNIATFDMGSVGSSGTFTSKLALNSTGKTLIINLTSGSDIEITSESFGGTTQISGIIKDEDGNAMVSDSNICDSTGTFGGANNAGGPYISSLIVTNNGDEGYIDTGDIIIITFNEAINQESINSDLVKGSYITGVSYSSTGGVSVSSVGRVTIKNIATFDMGSVGSSGTFTSKLALNSTGKILTITLTGGSDIEITNESFDSVVQVSGTIEDIYGNSMGSNSDICDPTGTFGG